MKILIASSIDPATIETLQQEHDVCCAFNAPEAELKKLIADRHLLIFRSGVQITAAVLDAASELQFIIRAGSGLDNIDVETVQRRGIRLERIPQPGALAVAEMTFALMLSVSRNVVTGHTLLTQGHWAKSKLGGNLISGKTLGIVGCGNIGTKVAEVAHAFGMKPIGCVAHPSPARAEAFRLKSIELVSFEEALGRADIVSLHVPLNETTHHLIDAGAISKMKSGAYLINIARGGVVDELALYHALAVSKKLKGAALDVHEHEGEGKISPLTELPNVVLTPHIGAMAIESQGQIGARIRTLVDIFQTARPDQTHRVRELVS